MAAVVEVNVGKVEASRQGVDWWLTFESRSRSIGRIRDIKPACVVGGVVEVACTNDKHADWLAAHMVENGLPRTAVRVKKPTT